MSSQTEDQGAHPTSVGVECALSSGSKSSARSQESSAREPGDLAQGLQRQADAGRRGAASRGCGAPEVGRGRSTEEVCEDVGNARRAGGGKDLGQGKIHCTKRVLDTERGRRDHETQWMGKRGLGLVSRDPRWEPGAGNPPAGICPGGGP